MKRQKKNKKIAFKLHEFGFCLNYVLLVAIAGARERKVLSNGR